jgi:hypothetical protein
VHNIYCFNIYYACIAFMEWVFKKRKKKREIKKEKERKEKEK